MKPIIEAVPKELIERELTEERLLRATNNAGNFIYTIKAAEAPDIMREIGRLRELAFRAGRGAVRGTRWMLTNRTWLRTVIRSCSYGIR